jgi:hypothetical protein
MVEARGVEPVLNACSSEAGALPTYLLWRQHRLQHATEHLPNKGPVLGQPRCDLLV